MTDELREAAERHLYEIVIGPIDDAMDEFKASDRKEWLEEAGWQNVSIRWIDTEHPADDDEPVTEEWLLSVGFTDKHGSAFSMHKICEIWHNDDAVYCISESECDLPPMKTRRQVRDLIRVLKGGE